MKRTILGIAATVIAMTTSAQTAVMQPQLKTPAYQGRLGMQHVLNPSDAQLRELGKRIGSVSMPTKAQTAAMIKKAIATAPSSARGKRGTAKDVDVMMSKAAYSPADTLLWESWEGWDGSFNWRPTTWGHQSNFDPETYISEAIGMCPTWMGFETDGYYLPYATDGRNILLCMYGEEIYGADGTTVIAPAPQQDEWMVSPTASSIQETNFLSFDLAFSPLYTHLFVENDEPKIDMEKIAYDVEVLVTTSTRGTSFDESKYTKIFKLSDLVDDMMRDADLSDEATLAQLMNMRWQHYKISLKEFAGSNIRVAFRYKGTKGGAVLLDAVRVSDMLPVALYDRPEGSFYYGFSDDARLLYAKEVLMPAYTPSVWTNYSNQDVESYVWRYNVNGESGTSEEKDLTLPACSPSIITWPTLQANAGLRSDEYCGASDVLTNGNPVHSNNGRAKVGGDAVIQYGEESVNFTLGNYDPTKQFWLGQISAANNVYAFGSNSGAFWAELTDYKYNAVSGIANVYDAPAAPYIFNNVMLPLGDFFNLGAELVCTVYEAKELENGGIEVTDNVLGQATCVESIKVKDGDILSFVFDNIMTIETPIAIKISGFDNPNILSIAPLSQALNHDSGKGYAFVLLKNQSTGGEWWCEIAGALAALEGSGNMEISHCIGMNAVFPYMHSNDGDEFKPSVEGEKKSFDISSYWYPEKLDEQDQLNGWTIECSDSWVKADKTIDMEAQKASVNITASPMPAGLLGRVATVTVKGYACETTITVTQGSPVDFIAGDANDDGTVSVADIVDTANYILGNTPARFNYRNADSNEDGSITVSDIVKDAQLILGTK